MKKPQLFFLHFAGGNAYSFQFMYPFLERFQLIPLELPGRGRRMDDRLIKDFDVAAQDLYEQIVPKLNDAGFLLYGHSMGAYLALRIANKLGRTGQLPVCLVVSGNSGPGMHRLPKRHLLEEKEFIDELLTMGGTPREVIENEDLWTMLYPILKADFQIAEENGLEAEPPVGIPVVAIMGSDEEHVECIENWGKYTCMGFRCHTLQGGHFFILHHAREMGSIINAAYDLAGSLNTKEI